ncbi:MAG: ribonuclease Z [Clostridiales bacterium]|nr:ribonuclease Z [Clostridiales bacterium]
MLDVCLLGTGGMMPLPYRFLTSMMARCDGSSLLIDCGEGTQVALRQKGWSPKPVDVICFTHYHADHISGLPGFLLTMGNAERTEPVTMIGPRGLERVVGALRTIAPELPFPIRCIELGEQRQQFKLGPFVIDAYRVNHNVACYGYAVSIPRAGRFDVERARAQGVPMKAWSRLQKGETLEMDGVTYTPDMVLGPDRRGLKVAYCTDTRPLPVIAEYAKDADLFICEGMYGEPGKEEKAKGYKHMTMYEAAELGRRAQPKEMWLTHYSPSLTHPDDYIGNVRKIFPRAKAARDGWTLELTFDDEADPVRKDER